jgi:RNA polymerase sigma factor (sigma-70 family)
MEDSLSTTASPDSSRSDTARFGLAARRALTPRQRARVDGEVMALRDTKGAKIVAGTTMVSDEELMERYQSGDRTAFGEIFRRYAPLLLRVMKQQLGRNEDASDLVQQTFLQLHRSKQDFRRGALLRPWLLTIAMNLRHRHFRKLGRHPETSLDLNMLEQFNTGLAVRDAADASCDVHALLSELPAEQRDVIVLHWLEGLSFNEVSLVMGVSLSAVKVRAHRGYVAIRKIFAQETDMVGPKIPTRGARLGTPSQ